MKRSDEGVCSVVEIYNQLVPAATVIPASSGCLV